MAIGPETPDDGNELSAPLSPLCSESSDLEEIGRRSSRCISTDDPGSSTSSSVAVDFLLSKLRSPLPSESARKRKIRKNPPKEQKRGKGTAADDPKNVAPIDRVRAYPGEPFTVSNRKLFCLHAGRS